MFISNGSQLFIDIIGESLVSFIELAYRMESVPATQKLWCVCTSLTLR